MEGVRGDMKQGCARLALDPRQLKKEGVVGQPDLGHTSNTHKRPLAGLGNQVHLHRCSDKVEIQATTPFTERMYVQCRDTPIKTCVCSQQH